MPQPDRTGTLDRANRAACEFFLSNIYAPRDFSQRDHDLECIHKFLSHVLPVTTIQLFTATVELNHMTNTLDNRLLYVPVDLIYVDNVAGFKKLTGLS